MGPMELPQPALLSLPILRSGLRCLIVIGLWVILIAPLRVVGQLAKAPVAQDNATRSKSSSAVPVHSMIARRFLAGRARTEDVSAARAIDAARLQHAAMIAAQAASPLSNLSATWQPVGPNQIASAFYGNVTGRVTSIALDPSDASGNTVYVGTTGGGVWKSTNAAAPAGNVSFVPLMDTLPVFNANAGAAAIPSLSIGAISVQSGVLLAGTGDPNDATDSFYGSGILRSADGGVTWTLIQNSLDGVAGNHSFTGLGFAGFAWSTSTPGTVVAAVSQSAEGTLVNAVDQTNSVMGLYYSTDEGVTWQMSTILDGSQIVQTPLPSGADLGGRAATAVVWNPVRQRFYAAIRYHGYYESADGATWTRLAHQPGAGLTATACPTAPGTIGSADCPIFRGALTVQAMTGDLFALTVDSNNVDQGLWQDVCALSGTNCSSTTVSFSTQLPSSAMEVGNGNSAILQADYNLALVAVPAVTGGSTQDTLLYAGTVDLYRCSLAAGCVLRNTTNASNGCAAPAQVAPAQHAIAALATSTFPVVYIGNDGGLWRSTDGVNEQAAPCSADDATHFQNLNDGLGSLAEVVSFAQPPTDADTLLVGLGANGTASTSTASSIATPWPQLSAGEGGTVAIDPTNPSLWYISTGAGVSIRQCGSGAACAAANFSGSPTIASPQVGGDGSLIDVPWLLDSALSSNIIIGTCRVWRGPADNGVLWSSANAISELFGGPQNTSCTGTNPVVRSLAASGPTSSAAAVQNAGSEVLYAGMAGSLDGGRSFGGHLFSITTGNTATNTTAWNDVAVSPVMNGQGIGFNPGGFDVSSLGADPHDSTGATIYVTVMGFAGNGVNAAHLYRSTDAGAHWSNVSSNLPNAPANSVVVDPNDANTVYVALDTGVYVTTQITTCAAANCWSVYGTGLPNAPIVELLAAQTMPTGDGRAGELRAATYGRGIWQLPLLTAATAAQPAMSLSPTSLSYATQAVATASPLQTITVTNTGSASLSVSSVVTTGDFNETDDCPAALIAVNSSCTIHVRFLPTTTGSRNGVLTIYGNVAGGQATAALSGTSSPAASVVLNPIALTFPSTTISATTQAQNITISNTGATSVGLQIPVVSGGDFAITANTCGSPLGPDTGCTVSIAFTPAASGTRSGTFSITDDVGTQTASLSGIGTSPATDVLAPLALTFTAQQLNTSSGAQQITLTNSGDTPLTLIVAQITSGDFSVINACGNSLNAHSTCSLNVVFQPKSVGLITGVLTVSDQYRSQTIALSGTGVAPPGVSLSPVSLITFPSVGVGVTSGAQTVTLTNNGGVPLFVQSIGITGDFVILSGSNTCGSSVSVNAACTLQIAFAPTAGGPRTGTLTVTDNASSSPQTLTLIGAGVDFSLNTNGGTSLTIASGQNAVYPLLLSSAANVSGTATFSCTGVPANATCTVTPSSVTLGNTATISVTVLTGVSATSSAFRSYQKRLSMIWLAMLLPISLFTLRKVELRSLAGFVVVTCLVAATGCGVGRTIPLESGSNPNPTPSPVTPTGTYTIVASAASSGLTRTVNLTLVVQ
jgi:hypothetical protein